MSPIETLVVRPEINSELAGRIAAAFASEFTYPSRPPYHPAETHPECPFAGIVGSEPNVAHAGVREAFRLLGLDESNCRLKCRNPLGCVVSPGDCALLEPNIIRHSHIGLKVAYKWVESELRKAGRTPEATVALR
jgi:hypothetical protein